MTVKFLAVIAVISCCCTAQAQSTCSEPDFTIPANEINCFRNFDYNQQPGVSKVNNYLLAKISQMMYTERLDFELRSLRNPSGFPGSSFRSSQLNSSSNARFECDFATRFSHWFYDTRKKPVRPLDLASKMVLVDKAVKKPLTAKRVDLLGGEAEKEKPAAPEISPDEKYRIDSIAFERSKPQFKFINKRQDFINIANAIVIPGFDPELMIISTESYIILAWRGTDDVYKNDAWEWIGTDGYFLPVQGDGPLAGTHMHAGMWNSFKIVRSSIMNTLDRFDAKSKNKKIFITGHSLGGGMAMISAPYLKGRGYNIAEVYTYAAPRTIGDAAFVSKCNQLLGSSRIQRFEYGVDFVTKLWSPALYASTYVIPGNRHWLNQQGTADDYNCTERYFPMTLNPLEYNAYTRAKIDKLNGDIGAFSPLDVLLYLKNTLDRPSTKRPEESHGYPLIDAGQHNPQYYVKKAYENMTSGQKAIMPAFKDSYPYVYPSVAGNK